MPGRGPAPKDPSRRARSNADPVPLHVIIAEPSGQPKLPVITLWDPVTERMKRFAWPARTRDWWKMWAESPLSDSFTETDWSELMDTALLHAQYWKGDFKLAGELRLRVAKFGATPEDRARLRITFAQADEAEHAKPKPPSSRDRRGGLTGLPGGKATARKAPAKSARRRTLTG